MDLSEENGNIIGFSDDITVLFPIVLFSQRQLVKALDLQPLAGAVRLSISARHAMPQSAVSARGTGMSRPARPRAAQSFSMPMAAAVV